MEKQKRDRQYVFSARTTEKGLNALNDLKGRLGVGWDALVIDAVCAHYGLDRAVLAIPQKSSPEKPKAEKKTKREKKATGAAPESETTVFELQSYLAYTLLKYLWMHPLFERQ